MDTALISTPSRAATVRTRRWFRVLATAMASALAFGLVQLGAGSAVAADATVTVTPQVAHGADITLTGSNWKTQDGAKGSIIAFKLDDGGASRSFDLAYPADTTALEAFKARRDTWGVVQADASGNWSVTLPFPTVANTTPETDLSGWGVGSQHSVRLLTGSLITGDVVRTQAVNFTVVAGSGQTSAPGVTAVSAGQVTYGATANINVKLSHGATGQVSTTVGGRTVSAPVVRGTATLALPARSLRPGTHTVSVNYSGAAGLFAAASATAQVRVVKAKPKVTVKRVKAKVKRGKTAVFRVTVTGGGVTPTGKVTVTVAGKSKTVSLKNGKATVKIKVAKKTKPGQKTVTARYKGNAFLTSGKAKSVKIRVAR